MRTKKVNGVDVLLSDAENSQRGAEEAQFNTLDAQKARVVDAINKIRDEKFWSNVPYLGTTVQFRNAQDRTTIGDLSSKSDRLVAAGTPTAWVPLILEDDTIAQIEASDFVTLSNSIMALKSGINVYARTLKNSVLAAGTETALNAIDINAGWPS
jgi:hypothetical protein